MDDIARELPDIDDIYADCDADFYLEPVNPARFQPFDEDDIDYSIHTGECIGALHFLL